MREVLIDVETLPRTAVSGYDLGSGPPGWTGPIERQILRRPVPGNYRDPAKIAEWEAAEDRRVVDAYAGDVDTQRAEAIEHWRRGSLRWQDVRIGCVGWTDGGGPVVIDAEAIGERAAIARLFDAIGDRGSVWSWGTYDAWVIRSVCLRLAIPCRPLTCAGRPWERRWRDLQAAYADWLVGGPREIRGISVREVAAYLGVGALVGSGAEVLDAYLGGRWGEVIDHCAGDVQVEWELLRALRDAGGVE